MAIFLNKAKNYIINGALDHWQRATSFTSPANNTYMADRMKYGKIGTMTHVVSRDTDVPALSQTEVIFPASMRLNLTTAQATLAAGDFFFFRHLVEGQVFAPLAGKTVTLSFWIKATLAGQFSVAVRNGVANRSLVRAFTVAAANTWEKKSITIAHDATGTWDYSTGTGLDIAWTFATGTNLSTASENVWLDGNFIGLTGQTNGVAAGNTDFRIAGIQLEEGTSASGFERVGHSTLGELQLCKRYYEYLPNCVCYGFNNVMTRVSYAATKRVLPSLVATPVSNSNASGVGLYTNALEAASYTANVPNSGNTANVFHLAADAEL